MDIFNKCQIENNYLLRLKKEVDVNKLYMPLEGTIGPHMQCGGKEVVTWCYNDYLGLASHPLNRETEIKTITETPCNYPMGSKMLSGNNQAYNNIEQQLAAFLKKEDTMLFATGYLAAIGVIPALTKPGDYILMDADAHACLVDAAKIAIANGAKLRFFHHNNMENLEYQLQQARSNEECGILIVCDGVYSMSGELSPLPKIIQLKKQYNARLLLDDAHGIGTLGELGRGTTSHYNLYDEVDLLMGTFSKAFASSGGFIAGTKSILDYLRYTARTNIFSHNLQLIFIQKILNSLYLIQNEISLYENLQNNMLLLQTGMRELDLNIGNTRSAITPLIFSVTDPIKQIKSLMNIIFKLRDDFGVYALPVTFPAITSNQFLIRFTVTAKHTPEDINITLNALSELKMQGLLDFGS